jgi:probable phosphoglycerate mutase
LPPQSLQRKYATGNVIVVSHKATIRIILCELLGIDLGRYRDRIDMPAGAVSIVKFDLHGPLLQVLGDRAYMGEDLSLPEMVTKLVKATHMISKPSSLIES